MHVNFFEWHQQATNHIGKTKPGNSKPIKACIHMQIPELFVAIHNN
ncbi:hypothetical protein LX69_01282 [Breznakibacter xylanolyticus]|uniref:Uncharacterized protein n=1 Tax=Breznakibacter xylanolyticus TaxID=990 RepID=A0A2W7Q7Z5_9BACT|nr:hypothetical protein LX69_01282 [Breznakibacter xylanolyticus]